MERGRGRGRNSEEGALYPCQQRIGCAKAIENKHDFDFNHDLHFHALEVLDDNFNLRRDELEHVHS